MDFDAYCTVGAIAVRYSTLKVFEDEKNWDTSRRRLIKRKKPQKWIETEISNEYAQFVVGQSLTETNYFETAIELCNKTLGISDSAAETLFKTHVLLKPEQRVTYAKLLQAAGDQLT